VKSFALRRRTTAWTRRNSGVPALAQGRKRRATGRAGQAERYVYWERKEP